MRKQFDDLSRSGKSKFLKRVKLSNEKKSSCTNNGVEKIAEENINKKNSTGIDSMHALYEGVTKKLIYLWIDPSLASCLFFLRPVLDVIDEKILKIRTPNFAHRQPREL
ncbi:hypothetical protein KQX54_010118 [Cotesia glomerata]|uniref:Uncharacterized protein n=1 Tax=Cotesia glomerata TaxID=32391 RepID=A0AAV7IKM0_COTGL|nr:hypothetical protein KQX54_010118 [Cotesia glomerata]